MQPNFKWVGIVKYLCLRMIIIIVVRWTNGRNCVNFVQEVFRYKSFGFIVFFVVFFQTFYGFIAEIAGYSRSFGPTLRRNWIIGFRRFSATNTYIFSVIIVTENNCLSVMSGEFRREKGWNYVIVFGAQHTVVLTLVTALLFLLCSSDTRTLTQ